jgi:hypothetical protein
MLETAFLRGVEFFAEQTRDELVVGRRLCLGATKFAIQDLWDAPQLESLTQLGEVIVHG